MKRVCVYPKDIARITGISISGSQKLLRQIRITLKKKKHEFITIKEFAEYAGIEESLIELE